MAMTVDTSGAITLPLVYLNRAAMLGHGRATSVLGSRGIVVSTGSRGESQSEQRRQGSAVDFSNRRRGRLSESRAVV